MTQIISDIQDRTLSCNIHDISVITEDPVAEVAVYCSSYPDTPLFSSTLATYNGRIRLCRLRSVIEEYMQASRLVEAGFSVVCQDAHLDFSVIFCAGSLDLHNPDRIFLSMLPWQRADQSSMIRLSSTISEDPLLIQAQFWTTGQNLYRSDMTVEDPFLDNYHWSRPAAHIEQELRQSADINADAKLRSLVCICGQRSKTWLFPDWSPNFRISFRNIFNCPESMSFMAKVKSSIDSDRQSAIVSDQRVEYFSRSERVFEVESEFLTEQEAEALQWALLSAQITIDCGAFSGDAVISDINADIDNDSTAERKIKFSFRPVYVIAPVSVDASSLINGRLYDLFTNEFSPSFL